MIEGKEKLIKRIEHWADHNDEHTGRFEEAAEEAKAMGLTEVVQDLLKAAEAGRQVSLILRRALRKVGQN